MTSRIKLLVSYGGHIINGEQGADYEGGTHRMVSLQQEFNFNDLKEAIRQKMGHQEDVILSSITYRLPCITDGVTRFYCMDITDDDDVNTLLDSLENIRISTYPQLYVKTKKMRGHGRRSLSTNEPVVGGRRHSVYAPFSEAFVDPIEPRGRRSISGPSYNPNEEASLQGPRHSICLPVSVPYGDDLLQEGRDSVYIPSILSAQGEIQGSHDPGPSNVMMHPIVEAPSNIDIPIASNDYQSEPSEEEDSAGILGVDDEPDEAMEVPPTFHFSTMNIEPVLADWIGSTIERSAMTTVDEFDKNSQYRDKEEVINAVKQYSLNCSREFEVVESNSRALSVVCTNATNGCNWRLRAAKLRKHSGGWGITRYSGPHSCIARAMSLDHRQLDSNFICNCILEEVRGDPAKSVRSIIVEIHNWLRFRPSYKKAWDAKQKAIAKIWGDWDQSYNRLPQLFGALIQTNPGSVVWWAFDDQTSSSHHGIAMNQKILRRVFWAFKPAMDSLEYTKPVIQIDGTFLYGKYKHSLLIATTIDGDNSIIPLAYALVESENVDSWSWFLALLRTHVVHRDGFCVISDRHVGIMQAMNDQYLGWDGRHANHRYCLRHVASNFNSHFKNTGLKNLFIRAGSTCQVRKCSRLLDAITEQSEEARTWINSLGLEKWSMSHDGGYRFGHSNTNIAECVNSVLKDARRLPVSALVQHTFYNMVKYFDVRRNVYSAQMANGKKFTAHCERLVQKGMNKAFAHQVTTFNRQEGVYEVTTAYSRVTRKGGNKHIVHLRLRKCSCGKFQETKIPCSHALAACMASRIDYSIYIDVVYSLSTAINCYRSAFHPLGDESSWPYLGVEDNRTLIPDPETKRKKGKPAGRRRNEMDVGTSRSGMQRCRQCGRPGHNRRSCPNVLQS